jgi:hypothetical protein
MDAPPAAVSRASLLLNKQPVMWRRAHGGYSPAERWLVDFADGTSCFAKAGVNAYTANALRAEYNLIYSRVQAPFLANLLAWEDGDVPLLILEDLSSAHWPPPWAPAQIDAVLHTLDAIHSHRLPGLPDASLGESLEPGDWRTVAQDPATFLALGLCSESWLQASLPALIEQERLGKQRRAGNDLVHRDIRSDNIALVGDRAVIIDWNWASRGNGELDFASWLPSLQYEGGPPPDELLPGAPHWAALISGYFAARAGLPMVPNAPRVRAVQLAQLKTPLPWAQRSLGLPGLDGPNS